MSVLILPFPNIDPVAIEFGPFAIRWYALAYLVGLLGAWAYSYVLVRSDRLWDDTPRPAQLASTHSHFFLDGVSMNRSEKKVQSLQADNGLYAIGR
jgi:prolipoprotein diacylglyceryltransferase